MAFRHRPEYGDDVPAALVRAREQYDEIQREAESRLVGAREKWALALAAAVDAGMSYQEVADLVGVSHSSIAKAVRGSREGA